VAIHKDPSWYQEASKKLAQEFEKSLADIMPILQKKMADPGFIKKLEATLEKKQLPQFTDAPQFKEYEPIPMGQVVRTFCDNPKCKLHKIKVKAGHSIMVSDYPNKTMKHHRHYLWLHNKTSLGPLHKYYLCETCFNVCTMLTGYLPL
jgi:hypothetical protein